MLAWIRETGRIAIGWGNIGDIGENLYNSAASIGVAIRQHYPQLRNSGDGGPSLWNFYDEIKTGDLVILSTDKPRVKVVRVQGKYQYLTAPTLMEGDYNHQRRVELTEFDPEKLWRAAGAICAVGDNSRRTLMKCARAVNDANWQK